MSKKTANKNITARWNSTHEVYQIRELGLWSESGIIWYDGLDNQANSDTFHGSTIRLIGGPRHGEIVNQ